MGAVDSSILLPVLPEDVVWPGVVNLLWSYVIGPALNGEHVWVNCSQVLE